VHRDIQINKTTTTMENFIGNARGLAKNPLGIIALFISLIYGFACLVLGISASNLDTDERYLLILFLIIFPVLVLGVFVYLVTKHHKKLYAPADYRDDKSFLETTNIETKNEKIFLEYNQVATQELESGISTNEVTKNNQEIKKVDRPNKEKVIEFNDYRDKYLLVEELALNRIEELYCAPINKNVRIKGLQKAQFDGVINKEDEVIFIEIKYVRSLTISNQVIDSLKLVCKQLIEFAEHGDIERRIKLVIFIVFEIERLDFLFTQIENLEKELRNLFVEIIIFKDHIESMKKSLKK